MPHYTQHFLKVADEFVGIKLEKVCCRGMPLGVIRCTTCKGQEVFTV